MTSPVSLLLPIFGAYLICRAMHPPERRVQTARVDEKDGALAPEVPGRGAPA